MLKYGKTARTMVRGVVLSMVCTGVFLENCIFDQKAIIIENISYHKLPIKFHYYLFDARIEPYCVYGYLKKNTSYLAQR